MNSNDTWRNITSQRAFELNQVYEDVKIIFLSCFHHFFQIVANNTFKNFDLHYFQTPFEGIQIILLFLISSEVIQLWHSMGGETWQLIELVDGNLWEEKISDVLGFHPTQIADALVIDVLWKKFDDAKLLPPLNPNNAKIAALFGNQVSNTSCIEKTEF
jgi:hypothetical protein